VTEVFARKASGLVREASLLDTFGIGFMNQGVGIAIWTMSSWGMYLAPAGNMFWGVLISILFCTLGVALVWGMLGGSMPRSGGDYIPNSRIIHPAIGVAVSMANAGFIMTFWIATLAPWVADPGMVLLGGVLGWDTEWFTTAAGLFTCAMIVNIWGFIIVSLGLKHYNTWQRALMFSSTFCLVVIGAVMMSSSHADFVAAYNDASDITYDQTIALANQGYQSDYETTDNMITTEWDWASTFMLFPAISWATAYGYQITFICGEVKRPQRNIIMGQLLAVIIPGMFLLWFAWGLPHVMGGEFVQAAAYFDNGSNETIMNQWSLPAGANFVSCLSVLAGNDVVLLLMGLMFLLTDILWMPISYLAWNRASFAWGMDRLGPMWFTDVNPRFSTAIKTNYVMLVSGTVGIAVYSMNADYILGLGITTMEALSVWGVTAISAILFPFVKRARTIWDASPYRWKLGGLIPVITIAGIINIIYVGILLFELQTTEGLDWMNNANFVFASVWAFGIIWYFVWKQYWMKKGIDISLAWKELPPA